MIAQTELAVAEEKNDELVLKEAPVIHLQIGSGMVSSHYQYLKLF